MIEEFDKFGDENLNFADAVLFDKKIKVDTDLKIDDIAIIIYIYETLRDSKRDMPGYKNAFSNLIGAKEIFSLTYKDGFLAYLPIFLAFMLTVMILFRCIWRKWCL